eukprot:gene2975-4224_t
MASTAVALTAISLFVGGFLRKTIGKLPAALATGGLVFVVAWLFAGAVVFAVLAAVVAALLTLFGNSVGGMGGGRGGFGRGGGGFGGGGGFSGGGGGFGGGGASVKHLITTERDVRKTFSPAHLQHIAQAISASENQHSGEIRFAVESALEFHRNAGFRW